MPLTIDPLFNFCAVNEGSACAKIVGQYYAKKSVPHNEVVRLGLNSSVTQIIMQKGDQLRATSMFANLFAMQSDNGTSYYFRLPVGYNGDMHAPLETHIISDTSEVKRLVAYLNGYGIKLSSFGNAKTIDVPTDFDPEKHNFIATPFWLHQHRMNPA